MSWLTTPLLLALAAPPAALLHPAEPETPKAVSKALELAKKDNTRALLTVGDGGVRPLLEKDLMRLVLYEYEHVPLPEDDEWAARFRPESSEGAFVALLDAGGSLLAARHSAALAEKEPLEAFLQEHQAEPLDAMKVLAEGLKEAAATGRQVFVHFSAPW